MRASVFDAFEKELEASSGFKSLFGSATDAQVESTLPSLALSLPSTRGGADVTMEASALDTYLYDAGSGRYCLALRDG